jgi:hypothetical protein
MLNLKREGIAYNHRKCIMKRIWHNFQPFVALIWLILSEDIPVEEWLAYKGLDSKCGVCNHNLLETTRHYFLSALRLPRLGMLIWKS